MTQTRIFSAGMLLLASWLSFLPARVVAAGSLNLTLVSETKVNSGDNEANTSPSITRLPDGTFVVAWHDGGPTLGWGRVYSSAGAPMAGQFSLNPNPPSGWQYGHVVAPLPGGGIVAFWGNGEIFVQQFDSKFAPVRGDFGLTLGGGQYDWPAVASLANGNIAVMGTDATNPDPVKLIRYDASLNPVGSVVTANVNPPGNTLSAAIAAAPNGSFTPAWWNAAGNIIARTFDINANPIGGEFTVNSSTVGSRQNPSLAYNSKNELWVAWQSNQSGNLDVYLRRFDSAGTPLGPEILVNQYTRGDQDTPQLAIGDDDTVAISWTSVDDSGDGVFARIFNSDGTQATDEFEVNQYQPGDQYTGWAGGRRGTVISGGRYIFTWRGTGAQGAGVYMSIFSATGATLPATTCSYSLSPPSQVFPSSAGTGTVGVITAAGCPWTASSGASFLSITSGSSGTGPGVVQFAATANTVPAAQVGTLAIAGQTATINQAGTAPSLLLSPTSLTIQWRQQSPLPASVPLSIFTAASSLNFTATASSTANWLTVGPSSGSAPATIIASVNPSSLQPGTYQGTVTVTAPTANPPSQTFTVSLVVVAAGLPALSVATTSLNYSFALGSLQVRQQRILIGNSGGGTLSYTASASTNSGGNWLSVTQDGAGATLSTPDPLTVSVDPSSLGAGTYTGRITITAAGATQNIPVTVTVSAMQQTILLSQTGLTFTAVASGGIVPPQTFGILNSGTGSMDWSESSTTVTGNNWLSITPTSGTTDANSLNVPLVTVSVNPANLAPGQYSGQIQVTSTAADNTPQLVSVILNVLPAGSNPGPLVLPTGLIFTEAAGGTPAAPQQIALSNLTGAQQTFTTGKLTNDGANWFSLTPATGIVAPTQASTLTVSVSSAGLSPSIRQGVLTLLFQDGSVRTVNILYLLATGGVSSSIRSASHPLATSANCTPTQLLPLVTSLGSQFTVPAGWPNTLATQVVDDCGNPHVNGTVIATFSNGDPPLPLVSLKNGGWTGTWQVRNANTSVIAITVNADNPALNLAGSISVSGGLQSSANAPVMDAGGVLNAASYSLSAPLSPGTMISIFGSNLANGTSAAPSLPLGTQLAGTLVTIGGRAAPLLYAGQGQINAIIPYGLPVNTNSQVIVQQGNAYTSPEPITLAAAQPAFFTASQSGTGQAIVTRPDGQLAQPSTPAQVGDVVVFYGAGLGNVTPTAVAGQAAPASPVENVVAPVSMTIGGKTAVVQFAGLVPGSTGLYQVNAVVPAGVSGNTVPVVLAVAGQSSPTVTMAVQ